MEHRIHGTERSVREQRGGFLVLVQDSSQIQVGGVYDTREDAEEFAQAHTAATERKSWVVASLVAFDATA